WARKSTSLTDESIGRRPVAYTYRLAGLYQQPPSAGFPLLHGALDEVDDVLRGSAGREDLGDAEALELGDVVGRDRAADGEKHVVDALLAQQLDDPRDECHVSPR